MVGSDFKELKVWKYSIALVKEVYLLSSKFPLDEKYGLRDQIRRAGVSVPSNIAEGHGRNSYKDFIRFLLISKGSLNEIETQCIISVELGMVMSSDIQKTVSLCADIGRMIKSLISYLENLMNKEKTSHSLK